MILKFNWKGIHSEEVNCFETIICEFITELEFESYTSSFSQNTNVNIKYEVS
jgi:hypothetical protein